jgi:DNA (cytosine-5)-methyltransferase 1
MTIGSLFSGIGGLELGAEAAGLGPVVWQVERDPFCREVLARHWPRADRSVCDVREANARNLAPVTAIVGGFPCQDVSAAGLGAGLSGARSGLWYEFARIVSELRPGIVIVENVASGARRWVDPVREGLRALGYSTRAVGISAFDVGAPHVRERVFIVASDDDGKRLWIESRGREREDGSRPPLPPIYGEKGNAPHSDRERESFGGLGSEWRWARERDRWAIESPFPFVANGVPGRVAIERAIGNAVVPQCAYAAIRYGLDELAGLTAK